MKKQPQRPDKLTEPDAAVRRRLPADKRRAEMLDSAAIHFARHGFGATTRDLATAMGVTQALIYKHFASKEALIEQALEAALGASSGQRLELSPVRLEEDLIAFYRGFVARSTETRMRLFMRAGLDGLSWPTRRGNALTGTIFLPLIAALRQAESLPDLGTTPPMRAERELVMALHASMVFLGIRRHVYGMPMPDNLDDIVDLNVGNFLRGAGATLRALHAKAPASLTAQLMVPAAETPAAGEPETTVSSPDRRRNSRT